MIDLDAKEEELPWASSSEELYELLQFYLGRIARIRTTWLKEGTDHYGQDREIDQRFGRIQSLALLKREAIPSNRNSFYLSVTIEGQEKMPLKLSTAVVELLQEDTQEWRTIFRGRDEGKSK